MISNRFSVKAMLAKSVENKLSPTNDEQYHNNHISVAIVNENITKKKRKNNSIQLGWNEGKSIPSIVS